MQHSLPSSEGAAVVRKCQSSLVCVKAGASWASGVVLGPRHVLTNRHLLSAYLSNGDNEGKRGRQQEGQRTRGSDAFGTERLSQPVTVRIRLEQHNLATLQHAGKLQPSTDRIEVHGLGRVLWARTKVVYVSRGPWDMCLLRLEEGQLPPGKQLVPVPRQRWGAAAEGQTAFVLGFALFDPLSGLRASVTKGTVARVVQRRVPAQTSGCKQQILSAVVEATGSKEAVLIQTDARVHSGNSGGMLVDGNGCWLGLVTSNVKHTWTPPSPCLGERSDMACASNFFLSRKNLRILDSAFYESDSGTKRETIILSLNFRFQLLKSYFGLILYNVVLYACLLLECTSIPTERFLVLLDHTVNESTLPFQIMDNSDVSISSIWELTENVRPQRQLVCVLHHLISRLIAISFGLSRALRPVINYWVCLLFHSGVQ